MSEIRIVGVFRIVICSYGKVVVVMLLLEVIVDISGVVVVFIMMMINVFRFNVN